MIQYKNIRKYSMKKNSFTQVFLIIFLIIIAILIYELFRSYDFIGSLKTLLSELNIFLKYLISIVLIMAFWLIPLPLLAVSVMLITVVWGWLTAIVAGMIASVFLFIILLVFKPYFKSLARIILPKWVQERMVRLDGKLSVIYLAFLSLLPFIPQSLKTSFYLLYRISFLKFGILIFLSNLLITLTYGFIADIIYASISGVPISYFSMAISIIVLILIVFLMFIRLSSGISNKDKSK